MSSPRPDHGLRTPLEGTGHLPWDSRRPIPAPLRLCQTRVKSDWVDYNHHMSESCYLLVFGDSTDAFFRFIGIDENYRQTGGHSFYTVETHLHNLKEVALDEPLDLHLQLLDHDGKRLHLFHSMFLGGSGTLLATAEQMLVHVDMHAGRAATMPSDLLARVAAIRAAHQPLGLPVQAGSRIGIRRTPV
ncbi:MAG: 4-hydroxybenzoyl-CoA thioesterase [Rhodoferax sp.]|nr:4-hydroxybenzoyl-CoA thioesterase [Rhodoferax sp.]